MSTYETRLQFQGFGYLVLITAMLAWCSMLFALNSTVFKGQIILAMFAATLYGTAILFIEREIVDPSKTSFFSLIFRGLMAVIIALVISVPFELEILKIRINQQIEDQMNERYAPLRKEQAQIKQSADDRLKAATKGSSDRLDSLKKQESIIVDELDRERLRVTYGPKSERLEAKITKLRQEIAAEQATLAAKYNERYTSEEKVRVVEIDALIASKVELKTDPLSRLEALSEISRQHPEAAAMSYLLKAFFLILELMPALMKFLAPKTEYTFYVEGRRALNEAKINIPLNHVIQQLQANPESAWKEHRQILDLIEYGIEDRATKPARSLDEILRTIEESKQIKPIGGQASAASEPGARAAPPPSAT